jgi:nucleotide-binding universal stress UspA family protein
MAKARIVVGVDDSPAARWALAWAIGEAGRRRLPLLVVHVIPATSASEVALWVMGIPPLTDAVPPQEEGARVISRLLAEMTVPAELEVTTMSSYGEPGLILTTVARDDDLLVVGQSERGFLSHLMAHSVRRYCARNARTALAVISPPSLRSIDDAPVLPARSRRWADQQSAHARIR